MLQEISKDELFKMIQVFLLFALALTLALAQLSFAEDFLLSFFSKQVRICASGFLIVFVFVFVFFSFVCFLFCAFVTHMLLT